MIVICCPWWACSPPSEGKVLLGFTFEDFLALEVHMGLTAECWGVVLGQQSLLH
jgi:hypothetical protein